MVLRQASQGVGKLAGGQLKQQQQQQQSLLAPSGSDGPGDGITATTVSPVTRNTLPCCCRCHPVTHTPLAPLTASPLWSPNGLPPDIP